MFGHRDKDSSAPSPWAVFGIEDSEATLTSSASSPTVPAAIAMGGGAPSPRGNGQVHVTGRAASTPAMETALNEELVKAKLSMAETQATVKEMAEQNRLLREELEDQRSLYSEEVKAEVERCTGEIAMQAELVRELQRKNNDLLWSNRELQDRLQQVSSGDEYEVFGDQLRESSALILALREEKERLTSIVDAVREAVGMPEDTETSVEDEELAAAISVKLEQESSALHTAKEEIKGWTATMQSIASILGTSAAADGGNLEELVRDAVAKAQEFTIVVKETVSSLNMRGASAQPSGDVSAAIQAEIQRLHAELASSKEQLNVQGQDLVSQLSALELALAQKGAEVDAASKEASSLRGQLIDLEHRLLLAEDQLSQSESHVATLRLQLEASASDSRDLRVKLSSALAQSIADEGEDNAETAAHQEELEALRSEMAAVVQQAQEHHSQWVLAYEETVRDKTEAERDAANLRVRLGQVMAQSIEDQTGLNENLMLAEAARLRLDEEAAALRVRLSEVLAASIEERDAAAEAQASPEELQAARDEIAELEMQVSTHHADWTAAYEDMQADLNQQLDEMRETQSCSMEREEALRSELESALRSVKVMQATLDGYAAEVDSLRDANVELSQAVEAQRASYQSAEVLAEQLRDAAAAEAETCAALRREVEELKEVCRREQSLQGELDNALQSMNVMQGTLDELTEEADSLRDEKEGLAQTVETQRARCQAADELVEQLRAAVVAESATSEALRKDIMELSERATSQEVNAAPSAEQQELEDLRGKVADLELQAAEHHSEWTAAYEDMQADLMQQLDQLKDEVVRAEGVEQALRKDLGDLNQRLQDETARGKAAESGNEHEQEYTALADLNAQLVDLQAELEQAHASALENHTQWEEAYQGLQDDLHAAEASAKEAEARVAALSSEQGSMQQQISGSLAQVESLQRELGEVRSWAATVSADTETEVTALREALLAEQAKDWEGKEERLRQLESEVDSLRRRLVDVQCERDGAAQSVESLRASLAAEQSKSLEISSLLEMAKAEASHMHEEVVRSHAAEPQLSSPPGSDIRVQELTRERDGLLLQVEHLAAECARLEEEFSNRKVEQSVRALQGTEQLQARIKELEESCGGGGVAIRRIASLSEMAHSVLQTDELERLREEYAALREADGEVRPLSIPVDADIDALRSFHEVELSSLQESHQEELGNLSRENAALKSQISSMRLQVDSLRIQVDYQNKNMEDILTEHYEQVAGLEAQVEAMNAAMISQKEEEGLPMPASISPRMSDDLQAARANSRALEEEIAELKAKVSELGETIAEKNSVIARIAQLVGLHSQAVDEDVCSEVYAKCLEISALQEHMEGSALRSFELAEALGCSEEDMLDRVRSLTLQAPIGAPIPPMQAAAVPAAASDWDDWGDDEPSTVPQQLAPPPPLAAELSEEAQTQAQQQQLHSLQLQLQGACDRERVLQQSVRELEARLLDVAASAAQQRASADERSSAVVRDLEQRVTQLGLDRDTLAQEASRLQSLLEDGSAREWALQQDIQGQFSLHEEAQSLREGALRQNIHDLEARVEEVGQALAQRESELEISSAFVRDLEQRVAQLGIDRDTLAQEASRLQSLLEDGTERERVLQQHIHDLEMRPLAMADQWAAGPDQAPEGQASLREEVQGLQTLVREGGQREGILRQTIEDLEARLQDITQALAQRESELGHRAGVLSAKADEGWDDWEDSDVQHSGADADADQGRALADSQASAESYRLQAVHYESAVQDLQSQLQSRELVIEQLGARVSELEEIVARERMCLHSVSILLGCTELDTGSIIPLLESKLSDAATAGDAGEAWLEKISGILCCECSAEHVVDAVREAHSALTTVQAELDEVLVEQVGEIEAEILEREPEWAAECARSLKMQCRLAELERNEALGRAPKSGVLEGLAAELDCELDVVPLKVEALLKLNATLHEAKDSLAQEVSKLRENGSCSRFNDDESPYFPEDEVAELREEHAQLLAQRNEVKEQLLEAKKALHDEAERHRREEARLSEQNESLRMLVSTPRARGRAVTTSFPDDVDGGLEHSSISHRRSRSFTHHSSSGSFCAGSTYRDKVAAMLEGEEDEDVEVVEVEVVLPQASGREEELEAELAALQQERRKLQSLFWVLHRWGRFYIQSSLQKRQEEFNSKLVEVKDRALEWAHSQAQEEAHYYVETAQWEFSGYADTKELAWEGVQVTLGALLAECESPQVEAAPALQCPAPATGDAGAAEEERQRLRQELEKVKNLLQIRTGDLDAARAKVGGLQDENFQMQAALDAAHERLSAAMPQGQPGDEPSRAETHGPPMQRNETEPMPSGEERNPAAAHQQPNQVGTAEYDEQEQKERLEQELAVAQSHGMSVKEYRYALQLHQSKIMEAMWQSTSKDLFLFGLYFASLAFAYDSCT